MNGYSLLGEEDVGEDFVRFSINESCHYQLVLSSQITLQLPISQNMHGLHFAFACVGCY